MKKINTISFSEDRNSRTLNSHLKITLIVVAILILGLLSFLLLFSKSGFDFNKLLGARDSEPATTEPVTVASNGDTPSVTETVSTEDTESDALSVLFVCSDDDKNVSFAFTVDYVRNDSKIIIKPIRLNTEINVFTGACSFSRAFAKVDSNQFIAGVEEKGIHVDKYVFVSEDRFVEIIQYLGPVVFNLDNEFTYKVEQIKYTYPAGITELPAVGVMNYLKSYGTGDEHYRYSAEAASTIIKTYFNESNISEDMFYKIINFVDSDISALDFIPAMDEMISLCKNGFTISTDF